MLLTEQLATVRLMTGEVIPPNGLDQDTLVSTEELTRLLELNNGNLNLVALQVWEYKAANYANLVNITEGHSSREMSDLLKNALRMVDHYKKLSIPVTLGRTRIGRIRRPQ